MTWNITTEDTDQLRDRHEKEQQEEQKYTGIPVSFLSNPGTVKFRPYIHVEKDGTKKYGRWVRFHQLPDIGRFLHDDEINRKAVELNEKVKNGELKAPGVWKWKSRTNYMVLAHVLEAKTPEGEAQKYFPTGQATVLVMSQKIGKQFRDFVNDLDRETMLGVYTADKPFPAFKATITGTQQSKTANFSFDGMKKVDIPVPPDFGDCEDEFTGLEDVYVTEGPTDDQRAKFAALYQETVGGEEELDF